MRRNSVAALFVAVGSFILTSGVRAQEAAQHWVGTATVHDQQVPVRLDLSVAAKEGKAQGSFVNAGELSTSSSGEPTGTHLVLHFDYFARMRAPEQK